MRQELRLLLQMLLWQCLSCMSHHHAIMDVLSEIPLYKFVVTVTKHVLQWLNAQLHVRVSSYAVWRLCIFYFVLVRFKEWVFCTSVRVLECEWVSGQMESTGPTCGCSWLKSIFSNLFPIQCHINKYQQSTFTSKPFNNVLRSPHNICSPAVFSSVHLQFCFS